MHLPVGYRRSARTGGHAAVQVSTLWETDDGLRTLKAQRHAWAEPSLTLHADQREITGFVHAIVTYNYDDHLERALEGVHAVHGHREPRGDPASLPIYHGQVDR